MSWWDAAQRVGLGFATGGLSEAGGARPLLDAGAGSDYTRNLLFGGDATKGIDAKPQQYDFATGQLASIATNAGQRGAPQIGGTQLDPTQMGQSRAGLYDTAGRLGSIANGQTAGAGELAVNRQLGAAYAAQAAQARAARGNAAIMAMRNAGRNSMDLGLAGAGQAAQAQMSDQQAANAQLGQIYGQAYGLDTNAAQANAQLGQQAQLANQGAQLQQTQMNDAMRIQSLGQMLGWDQARINAELAKAGIAATDKGIFPGLLQMGGQAAAAYATGGLSTAAPALGGSVGGGGSGPVTSPSYNDPLAHYRRPDF